MCDCSGDILSPGTVEWSDSQITVFERSRTWNIARLSNATPNGIYRFINVSYNIYNIINSLYFIRSSLEKPKIWMY